MSENDGGAALPGVSQRLSELRRRFGPHEFAFEGSTTGQDAKRLVRVVADASRRVTSVTLTVDGDRSPSPELVERAVDEAVTAAEAARSMQSFAVARARGDVGPVALKRRFVSHADAREVAARLPDDPPAPRREPRPEPSSVFSALGLDDDPSDADGPARRRFVPQVTGGDPAQGVTVTLGADGWTSSVRLEPWLARSAPRSLERTLTEAFHDAYRRHDDVRTSTGEAI